MLPQISHHDPAHPHEHADPTTPGRFEERTAPHGRDYRARAFTVGIGGPVGSGKTALLLALCRAFRDDVTPNLVALDGLMRTFHPELLFVESGGDNLAAQFSRDLADYTIYVIDVSGGDKIPRKGGPGITQSDLLVINKTDLAALVRADLSVMERDSRRMRGDGPFVFTQVINGVGVSEVADRVIATWRAATDPVASPAR